METIWNTYRDEGLMVLSIGAGQSQAACQTWIATHGLTHPVLADPTGAVYNAFGDGYVPFNSLIDSRMILQYTTSGFIETEVEDTIEALLEYVLWIDHVALPDSEDDVNPYPTNCDIGSIDPLVPAELQLHWNLDGGASFTDVILTPVGGDSYTAEIPAQPYGTTVYYYLSAADTHPRLRTDPPDAPATLHSFYVGVDSTPPVIDHVPLVDEPLVFWPPAVTATVTDNQGVYTVNLEFMINSGPVETVPMVDAGGGVYSADFTGTVAVGDTVEYRIVAVDVAASPNTATDPISGMHRFTVVERLPVFIYEPDKTPLSGPAVTQGLNTLGLSYHTGTALPAAALPYDSVFVFLGVYSNNHVLTAAEGQALASYLDGGGRLYMEGGDTWAYDTATDVHPYFHISGLNDGSSDAGPINGVIGTFTEGLSFAYDGENNYMDRLAPLASAFAVFENGSPVYTNGIAYDGGTYRTIGTSFELGGLVDGAGDSTKQELLQRILEFFEIEISVIFMDGFESGNTTSWSSAAP